MLPDRLEHKSLEHGHGTESRLDRVSPRAKLIVAVLLLVVISVAQPWWLPVMPGVPLSWIHLAAALIALVGVGAAKIPAKHLLVRWAAFAVPLAFVGLSIPLTQGRAGWPIMAGVLVKGWLSFTVILVLLHTTGFDRLLQAMRQCGVPKLLVAILAATYRYMFVLLEELERMRRAQYARTFHCPRRLSPVTIRNGTRLVGMLLVRCSERADRVHAAMLARGFDGEVRVLDELP
jgi:cobalt/nickel transport system permease protein